MTVASPALTVTIDLGGCTGAQCLEMAWKLKHQLDPKYARGAAVMPLLDDWKPRKTARKRANRAARLGYQFTNIERADYVDDIYAINTSALERQGRPMGAGYQQRPSFSPMPLMCPRHHVYTYGVLLEGTLVAYLWLYRSGELAMVSSILGHADHLENNVMYQLYLGMVADQLPLGGTVFYNLWNSGEDGLRFFKERLGLYEGNVKWALT